MKEITIDKSNTEGKDEIWDYHYKCLNCKWSSLLNHFSFCPGCGVKINWIGEDPND